MCVCAIQHTIQFNPIRCTEVFLNTWIIKFHFEKGKREKRMKWELPQKSIKCGIIGTISTGEAAANSIHVARQPKTTTFISIVKIFFFYSSSVWQMLLQYLWLRNSLYAVDMVGDRLVISEKADIKFVAIKLNHKTNLYHNVINWLRVSWFLGHYCSITLFLHFVPLPLRVCILHPSQISFYILLSHTY